MRLFMQCIYFVHELYDCVESVSSLSTVASSDSINMSVLCDVSDVCIVFLSVVRACDFVRFTAVVAALSDLAL